MPLPKKVRIDFILSKIDEHGNEISEEELRKAMLEISDRYGGSTALETSEGRYINKEGVRKTEKILTFYVITKRQHSTLERDLPNYKRELERRFNQEKILITYHDVTEVS
jgi:FKBP-type peptidyl-prolyl cis-trans isomerase (trigger factor)